MASSEDIQKLSKVLDIPTETLESQLSGFPDRGRSLEMPPKDPLVYRLYEIVQNYGYAYKAVLNEKFGDGIMSAISFSTKVEKETDEKGEWAKITLRGKWYVWQFALFKHLLRFFQAPLLALLKHCEEKSTHDLFLQSNTYESKASYTFIESSFCNSSVWCSEEKTGSSVLTCLLARGETDRSCPSPCACRNFSLTSLAVWLAQRPTLAA